MTKIKQTAGHDQLGNFSSEFAHYNDDILFGENWNNDDINLKTRCIITVVTLISSGITDNSLKYHLINAKNNGVTRKEIAAIITHVAFYAGWPKAWAAFNLAKEIWQEESISDKDKFQNEIMFDIGERMMPMPSILWDKATYPRYQVIKFKISNVHIRTRMS